MSRTVGLDWILRDCPDSSYGLPTLYIANARALLHKLAAPLSHPAFLIGVNNNNVLDVSADVLDAFNVDRDQPSIGELPTKAIRYS